MSNTQTVVFFFVTILIIAVLVIKILKNIKDEDPTNNEEIKSYAFNAIDDVISAIKQIKYSSYDELKAYVIDEASNKVNEIIKESGIKNPVLTNNENIRDLVDVIVTANFTESLVDKLTSNEDEIIDEESENDVSPVEVSYPDKDLNVEESDTTYTEGDNSQYVPYESNAPLLGDYKYEDMKKADLYALGKNIGLEVRTRMTKAQIIDILKENDKK